MTIIIAVLIALTGGVSAAAQPALPGDVLYSIKVNVNEEVRGWAALSAEAKANWEAVLASRRLEEAERLVVKADTKFDAETRADIETRFQAHADRVEARIVKLAEVDARAAADIAANFAASLKAHEKILSDIAASLNGSVEAHLDSLKARVQSEHVIAVDQQADKENRVSAGASVQTAAEGRLNAAENKIAEVEKFIEAKSEKLGATATAQAKARLEVAKSLVAQGEAQLDADAYGQAFNLFGRAHATAQEAKLLVDAKVRLEGKPTFSPITTSTTNPTATVSPNATDSSGASVETNTQGRVEDDNVQGSGSVKIRLDVR